MNTIRTIILIIHITAGFLSLLTGTISIATRKGGNKHKISGKIFYFSMQIVAASAVVLSIFRPNIFLLLIAFFGFYQNMNGMRAIRNKSLRPKTIDWLITFTGFATGTVMFLRGNIVLYVFGGISMALAIGDIKSHVTVLRGKEIPRLSWLSRHIGMMMGSYIATCTAFVVVNISYAPAPWIPWLAPTVVIVPLMVYFRVKFTSGRQTLMQHQES